MPDQRVVGSAWAALEQRLAPSSLSAYRWAWERWERWCIRAGVPPLPGSADEFAAFLRYSADRGFSPSTLRVSRAAVRAVHRAAGHAAPSGTDVDGAIAVADADAAARSPGAGPPPTPLTAGQLDAVAAASNPDDLDERIDLALIRTMRDALLRRAEVARLRWIDIIPAEDGSALVVVGDTPGGAAALYLSPETTRSLHAIRPGGATPDAPVFAGDAGEPISAVEISRRIARAARRAKLDGRWTSESPRLGMAADLLRAGAQLSEVTAAGRWRSEDGLLRRLGSPPPRPARNDAVRRLTGAAGAHVPLLQLAPFEGPDPASAPDP